MQHQPPSSRLPRRVIALLAALIMALGLTSAVRPLTPLAHADTATTDGEFVPLWTAPLLETKTGIGTPGGAVQKVPANGAMTVQALGQGGLPASGVSAASLKIHAVTPTSTGFLSVYPSDKPTTISTVSFTTGESSTNADFTQITATGQITVANSSNQPVDVLIAVDGYFKSGGAATTVYKPLSTAVLWDTRAEFATGSPAVNTPLPAWSSTEVQVAGQAGIPTQCDQSAAVALNIVALNQTTNGELKVEPTDAPIGVGTLQFTANDWNNSTFSVVQMSCSGKLRVTNSSPGTVNVSISVRGYFTYWDADDRGARYKPTEPATILDTAAGTGTGGSTTPMNGESHLVFDATGPSGVPVNTVSAVAMQIKITNPTAGGWITFRPEDQPEIPISSMVYQQGENASGFETQIPSGLGRIAITNHGTASIHVQITVRGFYIHKSVEVIEGAEIPTGPTPPVNQDAAIAAADSKAESNPELAPSGYDPETNTVLTTATTPAGLAEAAQPIVAPVYSTAAEGTGDETVSPADASGESDPEPADIPVAPEPTPERTVTITPRAVAAPNGALSLTTIRDEVVSLTATELAGADSIVAAYIQPEYNRVLVEANSDSPQLQQALTDRYGPSKVALLYNQEAQIPINTACSPGSRTCMNLPIKGGARYQVGTGTCSTGFSWRKAQDYFVLTAGHCKKANSWYILGGNAGGLFDQVNCCAANTTSNGDLGILQPYNNMSAKIFTSRLDKHNSDNPNNWTWRAGEVSRSSWVTGYGMRRLSKAKNDEVCTGGSYSGQICRWTIKSFGSYKSALCEGCATHTDKNVYIAEQKQLGGDCIQPGDSGGPVYTITSQGTIYLWGIIGSSNKAGGDDYNTDSWYEHVKCNVVFTPMETIFKVVGGPSSTNGPMMK